MLVHLSINTYTYKYILSLPENLRISTHTYIYTYIQSFECNLAFGCRETPEAPDAHTHTHTHTHTYIHTYIHAHTHASTYFLSLRISTSFGCNLAFGCRETPETPVAVAARTLPLDVFLLPGFTVAVLFPI
jgi:hypothetical protein